jgi:CRP/FNR family transcriptional regulator, cyclic AMP receptor protein
MVDTGRVRVCAILDTTPIMICYAFRRSGLVELILSAASGTAPEVHQAMIRIQRPPVQAAREKFDLKEFLESGGVYGKVVHHRTGDIVYAQGDPCDSVIYIQTGGVTLAVVSPGGKEAIVAMLGPGEFFGEGALAGQPARLTTATTTSDTVLLVVKSRQMTRLLHDQNTLSDRFLAHLLARNLRVESDLVDQLFNSSEKRLARTLLLLARYGKKEGLHQKLPRVSQEALAEMVGTTRSRVNFFMNKFRKLGYIDYNGSLTVHDSLLSVVLHD